MPLHPKPINNALQRRPGLFHGRHAPLMEFLVSHASILNIPGAVFENAVRFPDSEQLWAYNAGAGAGAESAVVVVAVADYLDQLSSSGGHALGESG